MDIAMAMPKDYEAVVFTALEAVEETPAALEDIRPISRAASTFRKYALEAKIELESLANISKEVEELVIAKLITVGLFYLRSPFRDTSWSSSGKSTAEQVIAKLYGAEDAKEMCVAVDPLRKARNQKVVYANMASVTIKTSPTSVPTYVPEMGYESVKDLESQTIDRLAVVGPHMYINGSCIEGNVGAALKEWWDKDETLYSTL
ncbi:hypothetical protein EVAR_34631_1 [Eumeta japonica]|uniref:Uncharacterized protein n=1 Tax=Eumeta variegata TaxID=151549 RepID=A0A4C1VIQ8_EUMVA|nr:hypothetical protein EVAR_34631_1 [Eumeta japonica]